MRVYKNWSIGYFLLLTRIDFLGERLLLRYAR